jgi:lysophospholipase L1-like esterase
MKIALLTLAALLVVGLAMSLPMVFRFSTSKALAKESMSYRQAGSGQRVLFAGDSTGVGTGAPSRLSVAGRLGKQNRSLVITNISEDGAKMVEVVRQLDNCPSRSADVVVIMAGGNDVIRFTSRDFLELEMAAMLIAARRCASRVVWIANGNVGLAPFFPWPLSSLLTRRARANRAIAAELAAQHGVEWVDLFREKQDDLFVREPQRYYAKDKLHPSEDGYRVWFEEATRQSSTFRQLGESTEAAETMKDKETPIGV